MKLIAAIAAFAAVASAQDDAKITGDVLSAFKDFQAKYNKNYEGEEWAKRIGIFAANLKVVSQLNNEHLLAGGDAVHGVTKFSDMTKEEFKAMYLTYVPSTAGKARESVKLATAPLDEVDWRTKGAVTDVKDQGQCGSCWAFSATEAIESYKFLQDGTLRELSPQQINSCDTVDQGCNGGNTESAYQYVQQAGGIELEADYPYTSGGGNTGKCKFDSSKVDTMVSGYTAVDQGEDSLKAALNNGPVSVCLAADAFQTYSSGILKKCPGQIDHCVQAVGYTADYWIIRNSWATNWGEKGFLRLATGSNLCHVADDVTFPTFPDPPAPTVPPPPTAPTPVPPTNPPTPAPAPTVDTCKAALIHNCKDSKEDPVECLVCAYESDKVMSKCSEEEIDEWCGL